MNWETRLTAMYVIMSDVVAKYKCSKPLPGFFIKKRVKNLTDPEILTMVIFCQMEGLTESKDIYHHVSTYLRPFFPTLGCYSHFNARKNQCSHLFEALFSKLHGFFNHLADETNCWMIDSMPIALAKGGRSFRAKTARGLADKGYCSSKKMHYYGVKLHIIGRHQSSTIPAPEMIQVTNAKMHDLTAGREMIKGLKNGVCLGDKAYFDSKLSAYCEKENNLKFFTPIKKPKNGQLSDEQIRFSKTVSSWRQPIESLFSCIQSNSKIQDGSKIRSTSALAVHIFSRLATTLMTRLFGKYLDGVHINSLCLNGL